MSLVEKLGSESQTDQILLKKKGMIPNDKNQNSLRNVIKTKEEE